MYMYIAVVLAIVSAFGYQHIKILKLEKAVAGLTTEKVSLEMNNLRLKSVIDEQNDAIEQVAAQYADKVDAYNRLANKPAEIRYKTVYKEVPALIKNSNECEDIKKLLDEIRKAGY